MATKQIIFDAADFQIKIYFPYARGLSNRAKDLPDSTWHPEKGGGYDGYWHMPADQMHCIEATRFGQDWDFQIDTNTLSLARGQVRQSWRNDPLRAQMYPYQASGVERIHQLSGRVLLAMDAGTGKTLTALGYLIEAPAIEKVLVIAPANATYKWQDEAKRWIGWDSQVIRTGKEEIDPHARMVIMSYAMLRNRRDMKDRYWSVVIIDEAHRISNGKSLQSKAVRNLQAAGTLLLTGTPVMNRPIEMWHLLHVLNPAEWDNWWTFARRYADAHDEMIHTRQGMRKVFKVDGASNLDELSRKLQRYMYRVTKADAMPWLPKLRRVLYPIAPESLAKFEREYRDLRNRRNTMPAIQFMSKLRQMTATHKIDEAVELAEDLIKQGQKVVVYAYHQEIVALLQDKLKSHGLIRITGAEDQPTKFANNRQFQDNPNIMVALVSDAGSEAIDLYASSNLIMMERAWNPGKEEQIEARLHRSGQQSSVIVHYLIIKGTVDEYMHHLVESKRDVLSKMYKQNEVDEFLVANLE